VGSTIRDSDVPLRAAAAGALAHIPAGDRAGSVIDKLLPLLGDSDSSVRMAAASALSLDSRRTVVVESLADSGVIAIVPLTTSIGPRLRPLTSSIPTLPRDAPWSEPPRCEGPSALRLERNFCTLDLHTIVHMDLPPPNEACTNLVHHADYRANNRVIALSTDHRSKSDELHGR
jgi:hypothetical protein